MLNASVCQWTLLMVAAGVCVSTYTLHVAMFGGDLKCTCMSNDQNEGRGTSENQCAHAHY